jgi:hypothetical protein
LAREKKDLSPTRTVGGDENSFSTSQLNLCGTHFLRVWHADYTSRRNRVENARFS